MGRPGFFLLIFLWAQVAGAQRVLLRAPEQSPPDIGAVATFAGKTEARLTQVQPAKRLVIAVLADTLLEGDAAKVRAASNEIFQQVRNSHELSIALLRADTVDVRIEGPVRSRAQVQAVLKAPAQLAPDPSSGYTTLLNNLERLGAEWSSLLVAGRLPPADPAVAPYLETLISNAARRSRIRFAYWDVSGEQTVGLNEVSVATAACAAPREISEFVASLKGDAETFTEVEWDDARLPAGFHLYRASLLTNAGETVGVFPSMAGAPGMNPPTAEQYLELRQHASALASAARERAIAPERHAALLQELTRALEINPSDAEALRAGADLYARSADLASAGPLLEALSHTDPGNAALLAEVGHAGFALKNFPRAEAFLVRARQIRSGDALVSEELGRIRADAGDNPKALAFIEESLAAAAGNRDLWFLRATVATRLGDWERIADSYEKGLALGSGFAPERITLARLYLERGLADKSLAHVRRITSELPQEPSVARTCADFLEKLKQPAEALALWRRTLELDPAMEPAHFGVAHLLLDGGDPAGAETAAVAGLAVDPKSARLHLVKSLALEKQRKWYADRAALDQATKLTCDVDLLRRRARIEDSYGHASAEAWAALVEALEKQPGLRDEVASALERGLRVSLRDGQPERARWFADRLTAVGRPALVELTQGRTAPEAKRVSVPGGVRALMYMAGGRDAASRERFLPEYARTVLTMTAGAKKEAAEIYGDSIREHFKRVRGLQLLGKRSDRTVTLTLRTNDKAARQNAERILNLIGWKLEGTKKGVEVAAVERGSKARRQETAAALGIDVLAMQEALQSGRPFEFNVTDDTVPVLLDEEMWRQALYPGETYPGGIAEALLCDVGMARTYSGLSELDDGTVAALIKAAGLKAVVEKYADRLYLYSDALAVADGRAVVPGGASADPIWTRIARADPRNPASFFRALLDRDDGKLLAFYFGLSQLDFQHQQFFTSSAQRTVRFYEQFRDSLDVEFGATRVRRQSPFADFVREIPLAGDGTVRFPGSPEVWMVAKGQSDSVRSTARLMKKVSKAAAPDVEDEILIRLAKTKYEDATGRHSQLDNFLAVAHLDAHRPEPLDETAAIMLSQQYLRYEALWPYFAAFPGLGQNEFAKMFALGEKLATYDRVEQNDYVGQVSASLELLVLLRQQGRISDQQGTKLWMSMCDRFAAARNRAAFSEASLDTVRELIATAAATPPHDNPDDNADELLRRLLIGDPVPTSFEWKGKRFQTDHLARRNENYQRVLEAQKVTSLRALFGIYDATIELRKGKAAPGPLVDAIQGASKGLLDVSRPEDLALRGADKDNLETFDPREVADRIAKLKRAAAKRKPSLKEISGICEEILEAISPQVKVALAGIVYAWYLDADDLLVSDDPLLLRKHRFVRLDMAMRPGTPFPQSELVKQEGRETSFGGAFSSFGVVSGLVTVISSRTIAPFSEPFASAQLGSLRTTPWAAVTDVEQRVAALRVRAAREWLVESALNPEVRADLARASLGLLSLNRRADLLRGLETRDWDLARDSVTMSDLFHLAAELPRVYGNHPWESPTIQSLLDLAGTVAARVDLLGAGLTPLTQCRDLHLARLGPYEQYEGLMFPDKLAARADEFKLHLAEFHDRIGLPAAALPAVAETVARAVQGGVRMSDSHDWRAILGAWEGLKEPMIDEALKR